MLLHVCPCKQNMLLLNFTSCCYLLKGTVLCAAGDRIPACPAHPDAPQPPRAFSRGAACGHTACGMLLQFMLDQSSDLFCLWCASPKLVSHWRHLAKQLDQPHFFSSILFHYLSLYENPQQTARFLQGQPSPCMLCAISKVCSCSTSKPTFRSSFFRNVLQALVCGIRATGRQVMSLPLAFPFRRPEMLYSTMWEELLSDPKGDSRLATSPHLPLHHLLAALTCTLVSYQVSC